MYLMVSPHPEATVELKVAGYPVHCSRGPGNLWWICKMLRSRRPDQPADTICSDTITGAVLWLRERVAA